MILYVSDTCQWPEFEKHLSEVNQLDDNLWEVELRETFNIEELSEISSFSLYRELSKYDILEYQEDKKAKKDERRKQIRNNLLKYLIDVVVLEDGAETFNENFETDLSEEELTELSEDLRSLVC